MPVLWSASEPKEVPDPIVLKPEPLSITPKEFYIADIIDERKDRKAVAWLLPVPGSSGQPSAQPVDLHGGALSAIQQFARQSLARNTKLRPVVVSLRECRITEKAGTEGKVEGRVALAMSFSLKQDGELVHLADYEGGVRYSRSVQQQTVVEPALRRSLASALQYLNTWMDNEASSNEKLAKAVKVNFTDYTMNVSEDTVFHAWERPLVWEDFRGKPRPGKYAAAIMPTFSYGGPTEVIDGIIHLNLQMKVYALRENCWVKSSVRDEYSLNHEQRHFDIVKLVAENFKKKISAMQLSVEDYAGVIAYEYIESFREMNKLQDQYDEETQHGIHKAVQERWNQRIDTELAEVKIKR